MTNLGGYIVSMRAPGRDGKAADVTLGSAGFEGYLGDTSYLGSLVGRWNTQLRCAPLMPVV